MNLQAELVQICNESLSQASRLSRPQRRKGHHQCIFPNPYIDGTCLICKELHTECYVLNAEKKCPVRHCVAEDCPQEESKSFYVTTRLLELWNSTCLDIKTQKSNSELTKRKATNDEVSHPRVCKLKVIIFSQFRQILNVVGDRLVEGSGTGCVE